MGWSLSPEALCNKRNTIINADPAKSKNSKECIVLHKWFFNRSFRFQKSVISSGFDELSKVVKLKRLNCKVVKLKRLNNS